MSAGRFRVLGKTAVPKGDGPGFVLLDDDEVALNDEIERASEELIEALARGR